MNRLRAIGAAGVNAIRSTLAGRRAQAARRADQQARASAAAGAGSVG